MVEEVACGANGTSQLAPSRRYTREEAGSVVLPCGVLPSKVLVVWVTGGRGCWASLVLQVARRRLGKAEGELQRPRSPGALAHAETIRRYSMETAWNPVSGLLNELQYY